MRARDIIHDALQEIGVYGSGETPEAADMQLAMRRLNAMLDSWSIEAGAVTVPTMTPVPLTAGIATYTVGPTGDVVTDRPAMPVLGSFVRYQGIDAPVDLVEQSTYNGIPYKTGVGWPSAVLYRQEVPNIVLTLYPVPSDAGMVLYLANAAAVASFPDLTTDVPFAPGYQEAVALNLACRIAPAFRRTASDDTKRLAASLKGRLRDLNIEVPRAIIDPCLPVRGLGGSILEA